jgi:hypothetical protein
LERDHNCQCLQWVESRHQGFADLLLSARLNTLFGSSGFADQGSHFPVPNLQGNGSKYGEKLRVLADEKAPAPPEKIRFPCKRAEYRELPAETCAPLTGCTSTHFAELSLCLVSRKDGAICAFLNSNPTLGGN